MTDAPTTGHCHNENYMKTTHPFVAPVLGSTQSKVNMEAYEQAIDQYNEGNYLGAFYQLLDHLNLSSAPNTAMPTARSSISRTVPSW